MGDAIRYTTVALSGLGVIALVMLMSTQWTSLAGGAQQLRYWVLLCYAVTFTYGGGESLAAGTPFGFRHVIALFTTIFMLVALAYTYRDIRRTGTSNED